MARSFSAAEAKAVNSKYVALADRVLILASRLSAEANSAREAVKEIETSSVLEEVLQDELYEQHIDNSLNHRLIPVMRRAYFLVHLDPVKRNSDLLFAKSEQIRRTLLALKPGTRNGLLWMMTGRESREQAEKAFDELQQLALSGEYEQIISETESQAEALCNIGDEDIERDFNESLAVYTSLFKTLVPSLFEDSERPHKVDEIYGEICSLNNMALSAQARATAQENWIKEAVDRYAEKTLKELLKEYSVEELGKNKGGFRIKALKDAGYETMSDLLDCTYSDLNLIPGIGEFSADQIESEVRRIARNVKDSIKIRLSVDDKCKEATAVVRALCVYKGQTQYLKENERLCAPVKEKMEHSLQVLYDFKNVASWAFLNHEQKQTVSDAYYYLRALRTDSIYFESYRLAERILSLDYDDQFAWNDFQSNPIAYYTLLEGIMPGILGNDDGQYGLPEDLAREIEDEDFYSDGLLCNLRRYQKWGVKYILHQKNVLLGDEMGLGKTVQAIATMVSLYNSGETHFLVVCPASVLPNWCKEISQKSKLQVYRIHGTSKKSLARHWSFKGGVAVATFESAACIEFRPDWTLGILIIDEAHYIKNPQTKRAMLLAEIASHAKRKLFMTGTALENRVDEMINLIDILQPQVAAELRGIAFLAAAPQFREKIAPVYYRRKREDVLTELPDKIESEEWCTLSKEEEAVYEQNVLSKQHAAIRRVSWNCVDDLKDSCKAKRMKELILEAEEENRKILVFTFFLDTIRRVQEFLGKRCVGPITGSVSPQRRQQIIDAFDNAPAGTVLIAQIQSGGTGLNIQSASVVIFCEPQFKPSIENQAISRAYRMGQARKVLVYRLLCEETIDERILKILAEKQVLFDAFADKSVSAAEQALEIDDTTFGEIIMEEIKRVRKKRGIA